VLAAVWFVLVFGYGQVGWAAEMQAEGVVLLDFYSDWCGPCGAMKPTVDALAAAGYSVERVDIDRQKGLAERYRVESIPCFIAVSEGREVDRVVGQCSYERLAAMVARSHTVARSAWRYERAVGCRSAVVRIYCQEAGASRSIGSGTLVRWNGRLVVLTARHVIDGAKQIIVELCTKRTHWAKVVRVDATWDCAVLELTGEPKDVTPVEVQRGDRATPRDGDSLESCGYGPDGRLACNVGRFVGFRRSEKTPNGPDDWLEISGHARQGDSGGPIFNEDGKLVGVLWGTNGEVVVGVQAGRIHQLLDAAVASSVEPQSASETAIVQRNPTPPKPEGSSARQESLGQIVGRKPIPCPGHASVVVQSDPEVRRVLTSIDAKVGALAERNSLKAKEDDPEEKTSPLWVGFSILGAVAVGFVIFFATQK
jgi:S1-C subfamily serine protease